MAELTEQAELKAFKNSLKAHESDKQDVKYRLKGFDFMRQCRLPLNWVARLREMHVGDTFIMGSMRHLYDEVGFEGVAEIYAIKEGKGVYQLNSNWTLLTKPNRPHRFSLLNFKFEKGGIMAFTNQYSPENFNSFKLTSRYIHHLRNSADKESIEYYKVLGLPPFLSGVCVNRQLQTTRLYYVKQGKELAPRRYRFDDDQMPKGMLECIVDYAAAVGVLNTDDTP